MIHINKVMLLILMIALISGCVAYGEKTASPSVSELTVCDEPRPQICTQEYNPVCANYKDGRQKTAATACTSCSDPAVIAYTMGACNAAAVD